MENTYPLPLPIDIPVPSNGKNQPVTTWNGLQFSPLGAYHLRCWQGVFPGIKDFFTTYQGRFRSADLAWFSSGMNRDGNHSHPPTSFHPSLVTLHGETNSIQGRLERKALLAEVKEQLFYVATMYDRLTGGTTMIISSSGTKVPGAPSRPEYLKASVYLPPAFIAHNPDLHRHIIEIVQHYIETVGVRTVTMWTQRARRDLHYSLTQVGNPHRNVPVKDIPSPEYNSAQYVFLGQPYKFVDDPSAIPIVRAPSPVPSTDSYDFGDDPDADTLAIIDLQQHNSELQEKIQVLEQQVRDLEEQVNITNQQNVSLTSLLQRTHERIGFDEGQGQKMVMDRSTSTTTPVQNRRSTPHPTPLRYQPATPSRADANRAKVPFVYSAFPITPNARSIHSASGTPSVSRALIGTRFSSPARSGQASPSPSQPAHALALLDAIDTDKVAPPSVRVLPHCINLYHLRHLTTSLELISNYTPAESRRQELLKLGLEEEACEALTAAMALDERCLIHN